MSPRAGSHLVHAGHGHGEAGDPVAEQAGKSSSSFGLVYFTEMVSVDPLHSKGLSQFPGTGYK